MFSAAGRNSVSSETSRIARPPLGRTISHMPPTSQRRMRPKIRARDPSLRKRQLSRHEANAVGAMHSDNGAKIRIAEPENPPFTVQMNASRGRRETTSTADRREGKRQYEHIIAK